MENGNKSKVILVSVFAIIILIVAIVGVTFALFQYSGIGQKTNTVETGVIKMSYTESTNAINLEDALPISDADGKALSGTNNVFDFTVTANITGDANINYAITAVKDSTSTLADSAIKVYLTNIDSSTESQILAPTKVSALSKTGSSEASSAPSGQFKLASGTFSSTVTHKYRLRMWVASDFTDLNASGSYKLKVNVYGAVPVS